MIAPEKHWGRDNSDDLVLTGGSKSLPPKIAQASTGAPVAESSKAPDPANPVQVDQGGATVSAADVHAKVMEATGKPLSAVLGMLAEAELQGKTFVQQFVAAARERSYRAWRNEHFRDSKYQNKRWENRSKVFKPKTRSFVRKAQAAAASALFSSTNVVTIDPQDNSNPSQRASAALKQELVNYRLDRNGSFRNCIPWFQVAMGAHQDALIASICVSKQAWKFRERTVPARGPGQAVTAPTGQRTIIEFDRPDVINIPPENAIWDPNCEWTRPAQTSAYLILRYAMPISDVEAMMKASGANEPQWLSLTRDEIVAAGNAAPDDTTGTRSARSGGADAVQHAQASSFRPVWVYENFLRIDGEDFTFWTVGTQKLLSVPVPTREAHPAFFGDRPVVIGFGALETHRSHPMSQVEALQPLQQEANDVTNLRLDHMKQVVTPLAKVRRGRQIDIDMVQRRSPDGVLLVNDQEDVDWDRPPDTPRSSFEETAILNNDFDDLAGNFSGSSVASNRQLNETVGGMKLLSQGANALTEFDLRIWAETWVEPVLWQIVKLEEYYEDDAKVLALAGQKADLVARYGIDQVTDHLLMDEVTITVSIGLGASDPMQALEKFSGAAQILGNILMPFIEAGKVDVIPNVAEMADEVFGKAGFKNAGERFFVKLDSAPPAPPPGAGAPPPDPAAMAKAQVDAQKAQNDQQATMIDAQMKREKMATDAELAMAEINDRREQRAHEARIAVAKIRADQAKERMKAIGVGAKQRADHSHAHRSAFAAMLVGAAEREHAAEIARTGVEHAAKHAPKPAPRANG